MKPCIEIVIYKVKNQKEAAAAREVARGALARYPGFRSWQQLTTLEGDQSFADIVTWDDMASAKAAGEAFHSDPDCGALMGQIESMVTMGHFA
jgi:heme-degrading monooxygenase HmoA